MGEVTVVDVGAGGADLRTVFEAFYTAHYGSVLAYARRRVGEAAARDVTAEVFVVAWRRFDLAAERGLPWLYTTAGLVLSAGSVDRLSA